LQGMFMRSLDCWACRKWIGIAIAFNLGMFVVFTTLGALCLAWLRPPKRAVTIRLKEDLKALLQCVV
jgi:hypothetical protein